MRYLTLLITLPLLVVIDKTSAKRFIPRSEKRKERYSKCKMAGLKRTCEYIEYVRATVMALNQQVCDLEASNAVFSGACDNIATIRTQGESVYEPILPEYYYASFLTMTIAYPTVVLLRIDPTIIPTFFTALRLHRTLGYGNALRLQGYTESVVQDAYWNHDELLLQEDLNVPSSGDGIAVYCSYTAAEYETLKQFGRDNYFVNTSDVAVPLTATFDNTQLFLAACADPLSGYIVRSDWEHHRREFISSLMSITCARALVLFTIWHWESLFYILVGLDYESFFVPSLYTSFDFIAETFNETSPDAFPCY